jgi:hypothetical protein
MSVRLYAVLRLRPHPRVVLPRGLGGERLRVLNYDGLSAAVAVECTASEPSPDALLQFDGVIRSLAVVSDAILPARFGVIVENLRTLRSELLERAGALLPALNQVAGRVQMTVRLPASPSGAQRTQKRVGKKNPRPGATYLHTRAAASNPPELAQLRDALGRLVRAEQVDTTATGSTVYHLVEESDSEPYRVRASAFRVSGPFPPYAFVPGIDHALLAGHDNQKNKSAKLRSSRPRTRGRSSRNTHR